MAEHQISLGLETTHTTEPAVVPELRDEIAQAWGLPLGERTEVCFRGSQRSAITGILELLTSPEYPWNPRQPLQLRIAGFVFSSRDIGSWTRL
jgi:hypothetical protein